VFGGKVLDMPGNFVTPTITEISDTAPVVQSEIFVPILHTCKFKTLDGNQLIALNVQTLSE
jgi:aldehyde dehydrogenase family 7 protein A1